MVKINKFKFTCSISINIVKYKIIRLMESIYPSFSNILHLLIKNVLEATHGYTKSVALASPPMYEFYQRLHMATLLATHFV